MDVSDTVGTTLIPQLQDMQSQEHQKLAASAQQWAMMYSSQQQQQQQQNPSYHQAYNQQQMYNQHMYNQQQAYYQYYMSMQHQQQQHHHQQSQLMQQQQLDGAVNSQPAAAAFQNGMLGNTAQSKLVPPLPLTKPPPPPPPPKCQPPQGPPKPMSQAQTPNQISFGAIRFSLNLQKKLPTAANPLQDQMKSQSAASGYGQPLLAPQPQMLSQEALLNADPKTLSKKQRKRLRKVQMSIQLQQQQQQVPQATPSTNLPSLMDIKTTADLSHPPPSIGSGSGSSPAVSVDLPASAAMQQQLPVKSVSGTLQNDMKAERFSASSLAMTQEQPWPDSLNRYVARCYAKCTTDLDKDQIGICLKGKIMRAATNNELYIRDWDNEPIPVVYSARDSAELQIQRPPPPPTSRQFREIQQNLMAKSAESKQNILKTPHSKRDTQSKLPLSERLGSRSVLPNGRRYSRSNSRSLSPNPYSLTSRYNNRKRPSRGHSRSRSRSYSRSRSSSRSRSNSGSSDDQRRKIRRISGSDESASRHTLDFIPLNSSKHTKSTFIPSSTNNNHLSRKQKQQLKKKEKAASNAAAARKEPAHFYASSVGGNVVDDTLRLQQRAARFAESGATKKSVVAAVSFSVAENKKYRREQPSPNNCDDGDAFNGDFDMLDFHIIGTCYDIEKQYLRLTKAPSPSDVRPLEVLVQSLQHVKDKWRSLQDYRYTWHQLKSIRQDLCVQGIRDKFTIEVYETHARIAMEKADHEEFNQCQTQLSALYHELGGSKSALEFTGYRILYYIFTKNTLEITTVLKSLKPEQRANPVIAHALEFRAAWSAHNFCKMFKLYRTAPLMSGYLIDWFLERERKSALEIILKTYRPTVTVVYFTNLLAFDSIDKCKEWLATMNMPLTKAANDIEAIDVRKAISQDVVNQS